MTNGLTDLLKRIDTDKSNSINSAEEFTALINELKNLEGVELTKGGSIRVNDKFKEALTAIGATDGQIEALKNIAKPGEIDRYKNFLLSTGDYDNNKIEGQTAFGTTFTYTVAPALLTGADLDAALDEAVKGKDLPATLKAYVKEQNPNGIEKEKAQATVDEAEKKINGEDGKPETQAELSPEIAKVLVGEMKAKNDKIDDKALTESDAFKKPIRKGAIEKAVSDQIDAAKKTEEPAAVADPAPAAKAQGMTYDTVRRLFQDKGVYAEMEDYLQAWQKNSGEIRDINDIATAMESRFAKDKDPDFKRFTGGKTTADALRAYAGAGYAAPEGNVVTTKQEVGYTQQEVETFLAGKKALKDRRSFNFFTHENTDIADKVQMFFLSGRTSITAKELADIINTDRTNHGDWSRKKGWDLEGKLETILTGSGVDSGIIDEAMILAAAGKPAAMVKAEAEEAAATAKNTEKKDKKEKGPDENSRAEHKGRRSAKDVPPKDDSDPREGQ